MFNTSGPSAPTIEVLGRPTHAKVLPSLCKVIGLRWTYISRTGKFLASFLTALRAIISIGAHGHYMNMTLGTLPLHIIGDIIYNALKQRSLTAGLELRLVCWKFNEEVLRALFGARALDFQRRWPYGHIIPFDDLAMVRYLHGLTIQLDLRSSYDTSAVQWRNTIERGAKHLRVLQTKFEDIVLMHEKLVSVEHRGDDDWISNRVMCESIVSFLGPEECLRSILFDELSSFTGTRYSCILNRPLVFWVVVACCHLGSCSATEKAVFDLRATIADGHDWRSHLNGCMYVAACNGHIEIVRLLINMGLDVNGRAFRGSNRYINGDGSPLSGAIKSGSLEIVELIIAQDVIMEGPTYEWALRECMLYQNNVDTRLQILKTLLLNRNVQGEDLDSNTILRSRSCILDGLKVTDTLLNMASNGIH